MAIKIWKQFASHVQLNIFSFTKRQISWIVIVSHEQFHWYEAMRWVTAKFPDNAIFFLYCKQQFSHRSTHSLSFNNCLWFVSHFDFLFVILLIFSCVWKIIYRQLSNDNIVKLCAHVVLWCILRSYRLLWYSIGIGEYRCTVWIQPIWCLGRNIPVEIGQYDCWNSDSWGPFYYIGLHLIPAWISN